MTSNEQKRVDEAAAAINAAHMRHCITLCENELRWSSAYGPFVWQSDPIQRNYGVGRNPPAVSVTEEQLDEMLRAVPIPMQVFRSAAAVMNGQKVAATRAMEHETWGIDERIYRRNF